MCMEQSTGSAGRVRPGHASVGVRPQTVVRPAEKDLPHHKGAVEEEGVRDWRAREVVEVLLLLWLGAAEGDDCLGDSRGVVRGSSLPVMPSAASGLAQS